MSFTGREVRVGKNCARGLEYGARPQAEGRTRDRGHSFSQYGPTKAKIQNPSIPLAERPAAAQEMSLYSLANRGALTQT